MSLVGIIAEYNPFHNGHLYHMNQARRITGASGVVVVMSGSFVQRGEPAVIDKYARARMALLAGADVVLELPVRYAAACAERFASAGVEILSRLGAVSDLAFGCETPEEPVSSSVQDLSAAPGAPVSPGAQIASVLLEEPLPFREELHRLLAEGVSFPAARALALESILPGSEAYLSLPNNILGVEYRKAAMRLGSSLRLTAIPRTGAGHLDPALSGGSFASATAIRAALSDGFRKDPDLCSHLAEYMPAEAIQALEYLILPEDFSLLLRNAILRLCPEDDGHFLECSSDLSRRIRSRGRDLLSFPELAETIRPRHLTRTHVNRALLHILLNLREPENTDGSNPPIPAVRLLGLRRGTGAMRLLQDQSRIPIVTKLADAPEEWFAEDLYASDLYRSVVYEKTGIRLPDEYRHGPVIISPATS